MAKTTGFIAFICISCICLLACASCTSENKIGNKEWSVIYNEGTKTLDYNHNGKNILSGVFVKAKVGDDFIESTAYPEVSIAKESVSDIFGNGEKFTVSYTGLSGKPDIKQVYYFYSDKEYFLTEVYLESSADISSNYIAPVYTIARNTFLPYDDSNRALRVPFDNDAFVHYLSSPLTGEDISFEVTSIFNGKDRNGLVIGSVEHDTWKTGIRYKGEDNQYITELECYGGVAHELTRDISDKPDRPSKEHGSIKGKSLKSPKIFFGFFSDWRKGLETFGEANALVTPPRKWNGGTPFGWNSWAAMAEKVNYEGAIDVSDFFKNELQPNSFENDNTVYIGLDSFWDNFSEDQLRTFVEHCKANGQKAGIYWCPFSDWHGNAEATVEGTDGKWKYKDIYLYANGKPRKVESLAVDPTHPATKQRMDYYINKFKKLGYTYVKLDFINNGTLEADSFYNPAVTTGVQAYNEGMKYLSDLCGEDMFMALSIAPTFPSQYGTSKRISCDAWGAMTEGEWGTTGYMLNSLSFGWWLDRVYPFNDSDHILLYKPQEAADYKEGANRGRITSAVITGIYMLGDNFSLKGSFPGDKEARDKAMKVATNKDINDIARIGKSFYPVEGYTAAEPGKAELMYMLDTKEYIYVAIFNFDKDTSKDGNLDLARVGLKNADKSEVKELWTSTQLSINNNNLQYSVPSQDVRVYRIDK
jgi:alpha-galactosidase